MGMPSISILLHEVTKMLHYAKAKGVVCGRPVRARSHLQAVFTVPVPMPTQSTDSLLPAPEQSAQ